MNIADLISFNDVLSQEMDDKTSKVVAELVNRLENFRCSVIDQLRAQQDIYFTDPTTEDGKKLTEGAKPGDVAVWRGDDGMDHWVILGLPPAQAASAPPVGANLTSEKVTLSGQTTGGDHTYYIRDGRLTTT